MRIRVMWSRFAVVLAPVALAAVVACGADEVKPATSAPPAAPSGAGQAASGAGQAVSGAVTIITTDNKYDKTALTVKAGEEVALTLENKGAALHDFVLQGVKDKGGADIKTELLTGGKSQTIKFAIEKAGAYDFVCQVHPAEMRGKLTVQ